MNIDYALPRPFDVVRESYGSSQMWHASRRRVKTGCGPAALANLFAWHKGLSLSRAEMLDLQEKVWDHLKGPVISWRQFLRGARRLFAADGRRLVFGHLTLFGNSPKDRKKGVEFIADALRQGRPPALLMGPQRPGSDYRRDFRTHWVLITALEINGSRATLTVSSWGGKFEVDLERLALSKLFLSLIWLEPKG